MGLLNELMRNMNGLPLIADVAENESVSTLLEAQLAATLPSFEIQPKNSEAELGPNQKLLESHVGIGRSDQFYKLTIKPSSPCSLLNGHPELQALGGKEVLYFDVSSGIDENANETEQFKIMGYGFEARNYALIVSINPDETIMHQALVVTPGYEVVLTLPELLKLAKIQYLASREFPLAYVSAIALIDGAPRALVSAGKDHVGTGDIDLLFSKQLPQNPKRKGAYEAISFKGMHFYEDDVPSSPLTANVLRRAGGQFVAGATVEIADLVLKFKQSEIHVVNTVQEAITSAQEKEQEFFKGVKK